MLAEMKRGETVRQSYRPCTLTWATGRVAAREGVWTQAIDLQLGGYADDRACNFYVERASLSTAPAIGTVFTTATGAKWRLQKITSGLSRNDAQWIFATVEEHTTK